MPINCDVVLQELVSTAPDQTANIEIQIEQIEEQQVILDEKNQSYENVLLIKQEMI